MNKLNVNRVGCIRGDYSFKVNIFFVTKNSVKIRKNGCRNLINILGINAIRINIDRFDLLNRVSSNAKT